MRQATLEPNIFIVLTKFSGKKYIEIIIQRIKARSIAEKRKDDNEDVIKTRIANYYKETKPLSNYYKNEFSSAYCVIDGNQEIQKLNTEILKIIKKT